MVTMETMAKQVRELYLGKFQPQRRPHAFSPNVLLRRLDPALCEKLTARNNRERINEGQSEEEDWLGADGNDVVVSDNDWSPAEPTATPPVKNKTETVSKKRKRNTGGGRGRKKNSITSMLRGIKQERQDDDVTPIIPMTVVPTTVYSQSDSTVEDPLSQADPLAVTGTSTRTRIKKEPEENVIVMPFGTEAGENAQGTDNSDQVVLGDSTEEADDVPGNKPVKSLKELTQYLLELNNKNLQFEDRIQKLREEHERRIALVEQEKKLNEKEIDRVLAQIQSWKPPSSPASFVEDASGARSSSSTSSSSSQKRKKKSTDPETEDLAIKKKSAMASLQLRPTRHFLEMWTDEEAEDEELRAPATEADTDYYTTADESHNFPEYDEATCLGCNRHGFKSLLGHLARSVKCQGKYDMEKLKIDLAVKKKMKNKELKKAYKERHKEEVIKAARQYQAKYYAANREKKIAYQAQYYASIKEMRQKYEAQTAALGEDEDTTLSREDLNETEAGVGILS